MTLTYGIYLYESAGTQIWNQTTQAQVWGIDISRDGKYVAAGSSEPEDKLYLYDRVMDSLWTYDAGGEVREVEFSHNGSYLAAGSTQTGGAGSVGLFDVTTHQLLWQYDTANWVREITFSPDDSYVAVANSSGYLYVFNTPDGMLQWKRFHGGYVPFVLDISQDGSRIVTGGKSHEVRMFDGDGNLLWTYPTDQVITDGGMSADASKIIVGTAWRGIYCLDGNGNLLWRRARNVGHNAVYMTQNGKYIALGGPGIMLLDNEGTVLWQDDYGWVDYVAISEDGTKIVAGYSEPDIIRFYTASVPIPNLKANGSDGLVTIFQGDLLTVTVSLDTGSHEGENADWWVAADTPFGLYWFNGTTWTPSQSVARQEPLFDIDSYEILNTTGLPPGTYTIYFGVDLSMDGALNDPLYYDSVVVTNTPKEPAIKSSFLPRKR